MSKQKRPFRRLSLTAVAAACSAIGLLAPAPSALAAPPSNLTPPAISGTPIEGQTLNASQGTWTDDPTAFAYEWQRCNPGCTQIAGATTNSYGLTAADVGFTIKVLVTASNAEGPSATAAESANTLPIVAAPPPDTQPQNTVAPVVSGTPRAGETLSTSDGTWTGSPAPTFSYQWQRCAAACTNIGGETSDQYTLQRADAGLTIRAIVTGQNSAGEASAPSNQVGPVTAAPENSAPPEVGGPEVDGSVLTAFRGAWTGTPTPTYAYQWQRCSGATCPNIPGATGPNYTLTTADIGSTIRVVVTATNSAGSGSAESAQTGTVAARPAQPPQNLAPPTISGAASLGQTLSGGDGVWQGTQPITFTRRWLRCSAAGCAAIPGATGATYLIGTSDVGYSLRFQVSGDNSASPQPVPATSGPTATVVQNIGPNAAFRVSPSKPVVGDTVDFTSFSADPDGPVASHAWDLDGDGQYADDNASGQIAAKKFTRVGTYTVRLRVTDTDGAADVETARITVGLPRLLTRPVLDVTGSFRRRYTTIRRMTLSVRSGAMIKSACAGSNCPRSGSASVRSKGKAIRFRRYERNFRPGSKIAFRVTYPERVGRYVSYLIRRGQRPLKTFRCLVPGSSKPIACPEE